MKILKEKVSKSQMNTDQNYLLDLIRNIELTIEGIVSGYEVVMKT